MDSKAIMQKITEEFIAETHDMIDIVSGSILDLEKNKDSELVNSIYRVFHTIKGNAYLAGFTEIGKLAHKLEDVLSVAKTGAIEISTDLIDNFLNSIDMIKVMTDNIENGIEEQVDTSSMMTVLDRIISSASQFDTTTIEVGEKQELETGNDSDSLYEVKESGKSTAGYGDNFAEDEILGNLARNSFRPLRILIVEDDFTSRQLLVAALSRYGDCHIAKDGLEAVQAVIESYEMNPTAPYDLICMDVQMPNMDGTVASKTIREIERGKDIEGTEFESIIIMISCVEDPRVIMKACYKCGANHYFVKPLDLNQMTRQMQKLGLISLQANKVTA